MPWTDDQIETLKTEWTAGKPASAIARILGNGHTRNSVRGKAHRLGLAEREGGDHQTRSFAKRRTCLRLVKPPPPEVPPLRLENGEFVTVMTLNDRRCRWPVGHPTDEDFHFCGHRPKVGSVYCEAHYRRSVIPLPDYWRRFRPPGYG